MRIRDGSSDVCSSDLKIGGAGLDLDAAHEREQTVIEPRRRALEPRQVRGIAPHGVNDLKTLAPFAEQLRQQRRRMLKVRVHHEDRKSVVEGKSVSVRVNLGGSGKIKKKNNRKK